MGLVLRGSRVWAGQPPRFVLLPGVLFLPGRLWFVRLQSGLPLTSPNQLDRPFRADVIAQAAACTEFLVNYMGFFLLTADGTHWALPLAEATAIAQIR